MTGVEAQRVVGSESWNADVYNSLSIVSSMLALAREKRQALNLYVALVRINSSLRVLFGALDELLEKAQRGEKSSEPPSPEEDFRDGFNQFIRLTELMDRACGRLVDAGYRDKPLMKKQIATLEAMHGRAVDYVMWIQDSLDPEQMTRAAESFATATAEFEKGETVEIA